MTPYLIAVVNGVWIRKPNPDFWRLLPRFQRPF
jgi:hypothetical protein